MKTSWRMVFCATILMLVGLGASDSEAQENAPGVSVLHIQQTQTTSQGSQNGFPTYLSMYHVLDGAKSQAEVLSLNGTIT